METRSARCMRKSADLINLPNMVLIKHLVAYLWEQEDTINLLGSDYFPYHSPYRQE